MRLDGMQAFLLALAALVGLGWLGLDLAGALPGGAGAVAAFCAAGAVFLLLAAVAQRSLRTAVARDDLPPTGRHHARTERWMDPPLVHCENAVGAFVEEGDATALRAATAGTPAGQAVEAMAARHPHQPPVLVAPAWMHAARIVAAGLAAAVLWATLLAAGVAAAPAGGTALLLLGLLLYLLQWNTFGAGAAANVGIPLAGLGTLFLGGLLVSDGALLPLLWGWPGIAVPVLAALPWLSHRMQRGEVPRYAVRRLDAGVVAAGRRAETLDALRRALTLGVLWGIGLLVLPATPMPEAVVDSVLGGLMTLAALLVAPPLVRAVALQSDSPRLIRQQETRRRGRADAVLQALSGPPVT